MQLPTLLGTASLVGVLVIGGLSGCGASGRRSGGGGGGGGGGGEQGGVNPGFIGGDEAGEDVWVAPDVGADDGDPGEGGGQGGGEGAGAGDVELPEGGGDCQTVEEGTAQACSEWVLGACDPGWRWCLDGSWTECQDFVGPVGESCDDLDNDCDGMVDPDVAGCAPFEDGDPTGLDSQREALERVNAYRIAAGLRRVRFHPSLNRAATNHAEYNRRNGGAHGESRGMDGFTGADPGARAAHEEYDGPPFIFEDMAFGSGPAGAVDMWFHSVYHRVPIMRPDAVLIGFGSHPRAEVLNVAVDNGVKSVHALSPYDGEQDVPVNFHSDREGPDPVPDDGEVGYPISVITSYADVRLESASVRTDDGEELPLYEATVQGPHRGFLNDSVFVMPRRPMAEDSWHTVDLTYTAGGASHHRVWRFRTGSVRFR